MFKIFILLGKFEKEIVRERTFKGLSSARSRGKNGGRPKGLSKNAQSLSHLAAKLYTEKKLSIQEIVDKLKISRSTLYSYLRYRRVEIGKYTAKKVNTTKGISLSEEFKEWRSEGRKISSNN